VPSLNRSPISSGKRKRGVDEEAEEPASSSTDIVRKRRRFTEDGLPPLSYMAIPSNYNKLSSSRYDFHRPPNPQAIPLPLLHPIFSRFIENAQNHQPTVEDYTVVRKLCDTVSKTWETEAITAEAIRSILSWHYEIQLYPASVGASKRITDGHIMHLSYMLVVLEVKRYSGNRDPAVQGAMYTLEAIRHALRQHQDPLDVFPCIVIYVNGRCLFLIQYYPILTLGGSSQERR